MTISNPTIIPNDHDNQMLLNMGIWLAKLLQTYNVNRLTYKVNGVTDSKGVSIGDYQLMFKKL